MKRLACARRRRGLAALAFTAAAAVLLAPRRAEAYAWMIGRGFAGCATCHADPTGGGLLNAFGREEAADSLRSHYGQDPPPVAANLGLLDNPDWLLTGGSFRYLALFMKT